VRLFFALELPPEVKRALGKLRPSVDDSSYRWVDPASMHLTLAFLGEQPAARLDALDEVGSAAASASRPGVLRLGAPGTFGGRNAPRVLWVGLDGDLDALGAIQARLDRGLRHAGFELEERAYSPHITLARRRPAARGGAPPGWPPEHVSRDPIPVDHVTLFESRLSPRGATYIALRDFPLAATD
jgi:2'-5' RNA ligase